MAIAKREIQRLNRIVTSFLDFAHPPRPKSQPFNLQATIEVAVRLAGPTLACRRIEVNVRAPQTPLTVDADVEQVQRALIDLLLANASARSVTRLQIDVQQVGAFACLTMVVYGLTAEPSTLSQLFEPFQNSNLGHGLELATAHRLIENQNGTLRAKSIDGYLGLVLELPISRHGESLKPLLQVAV